LLSDVLAPLYLSHRYQIAATAKLVGGLEYAYALRGDGQPAARPVDGERQREALMALLDALDPAELDLPDELIAVLLPRPTGYASSDDSFRSDTAPAFDALGVAATAADLVVGALLQPDRCARLVDAERRDASMLGFAELLDALIARVLDTSALPERRAEIRRVVREVVVAALIELAGDRDASATVRLRAETVLIELLALLDDRVRTKDAEGAQVAALGRRIRRWVERPWDGDAPRSAAPPPAGSPIGNPPGPAGCSRGAQLDGTTGRATGVRNPRSEVP
jgi:hypothetical protein